MEFIVWVETRLAGKRLEIQEVARVERGATGIGPEELGLTLDDGKTVLKQVQARIVPSRHFLQLLSAFLAQIEAIPAAAKATVRDLREMNCMLNRGKFFTTESKLVAELCCSPNRMGGVLFLRPKNGLNPR